ncbi:hypothetical protein CDAR_36921 [Caerostris darwini]|uniref:Uncharacterized protein n=1 Tax=Caerostris darwini TaxID=1538125 RepID=A0AAV4UVP1_9ARAC|nr:hypothetical protein CDAR_36921 [Caerostris darwini]
MTKQNFQHNRTDAFSLKISETPNKAPDRAALVVRHERSSFHSQNSFFILRSAVTVGHATLPTKRDMSGQALLCFPTHCWLGKTINW